MCGDFRQEGDAFCEEVGDGERAATDGAEREQRGGSDKRMSQAPTGNDSAEMSYRFVVVSMCSVGFSVECPSGYGLACRRQIGCFAGTQ